MSVAIATRAALLQTLPHQSSIAKQTLPIPMAYSKTPKQLQSQREDAKPTTMPKVLVLPSETAPSFAPLPTPLGRDTQTQPKCATRWYHLE